MHAVSEECRGVKKRGGREGLTADGWKWRERERETRQKKTERALKKKPAFEGPADASASTSGRLSFTSLNAEAVPPPPLSLGPSVPTIQY